MKLLSCLLLSTLFLFTNHNPTKTIDVTITGIRSSEGMIRIGVFKDDESFQNETAEKHFEFEKTNLQNGTMTVQITLETGIVGLSLLDDENRDSKMNYNFIGLPKEGFGFSDFYLSGMSKPRFEDFDFNLDENKNEVGIKIRYIL